MLLYGVSTWASRLTACSTQVIERWEDRLRASVFLRIQLTDTPELKVRSSLLLFGYKNGPKSYFGWKKSFPCHKVSRKRHECPTSTIRKCYESQKRVLYQWPSSKCAPTPWGPSRGFVYKTDYASLTCELDQCDLADAYYVSNYTKSKLQRVFLITD